MSKTKPNVKRRPNGSKSKPRKRKGTGLGRARAKRRYRARDKHKRRHGSCPRECGLQFHSGIDCYYAGELKRINGFAVDVAPVASGLAGATMALTPSGNKQAWKAWGIKSAARGALRIEIAKKREAAKHG